MLPLPAKLWIGQRLCHPLVGLFIAFVFKDRIPSRGLRIDVSQAALPAAIKASLFWGFYENTEIRFIKQYLRTDLDVVELGASLGVVTSHIARKLRGSHQLICVEANPHLITSIQANVRYNAPEAKFSVIHGAVSYTSENIPSTLQLGSNNTNSSFVENSSLGLEAPKVRLQTILAEHNINSYALVSDIEGSEAGLLSKDLSSLAGCQQMIIELHKAAHEGEHFSTEHLREILQDCGFTLRDQHGAVYMFERLAV